MKDGIRKILRLIGSQHRKHWLLLVGCAVLVGVIESLATLLIFGLLALLTTGGGSESLDLPILGDVRARFSYLDDQAFLTWAAVTVAIFFLARAMVVLGQSYLQNRLAQNAGVRLAARLLAGYLDMPYIFYLRRNSAEMIRNAHHSVTQIVTFGFVPLVLLASEGILIAAIVVALFIAAPTATGLSILAIAPIVLGLLRLMQKGMKTLGETTQETNKKALQILQESFQSLRDIRILGREEFFTREFSSHRARLGRALYLRGVLIEIPRVTTETLLVGFILVFLIVATLVGSDLNRSLALLGTFGYAGVRLLPALNRIVANLNNLRFVAAAVDDVTAELDAFASWEKQRPATGPLLTFERAVEVRDVTFRFTSDGPDVLNGITFTIDKGSSVGIVGTTGAGKSTLLDIIMGLLVPTTGTVTVDGGSIHTNLPSWHEKLGVVPQSTFLLDTSLRRNIALGLARKEIDEGRLEEVVRFAELDQLVDELDDGLETVVGERGVKLSGGQRQRVAIARALYRAPEVLVFDEATAALDTVTEGKIMESLEDLHGDRTMILIAHRLTTVKGCDTIVVLDRGRITDTGTYDELKQRNVLFREAAG